MAEWAAPYMGPPGFVPPVSYVDLHVAQQLWQQQQLVREERQQQIWHEQQKQLQAEHERRQQQQQALHLQQIQHILQQHQQQQQQMLPYLNQYLRRIAPPLRCSTVPAVHPPRCCTRCTDLRTGTTTTMQRVRDSRTTSTTRPLPSKRKAHRSEQ